MPIFKSKNELDLLRRVDAGYRAGETQDALATAEEFRSAGSLCGCVNRLGFRFERKGGLRLVDCLTGRDLTDWIASGDLCPAPEAEEVAA